LADSSADKSLGVIPRICREAHDNYGLLTSCTHRNDQVPIPTQMGDTKHDCDDPSVKLTPKTYRYDPHNPHVADYLCRRYIIVNWLSLVGEEFKLRPETVNVAMGFLDRVLLRNRVARSKWQLFAAACLAIAVKNEENRRECRIPISKYAWVTSNSYTVDEVVGAELKVLDVLQWELGVLRPIYPVAVAGSRPSATTTCAGDLVDAVHTATAPSSLIERVSYAVTAVAKTDESIDTECSKKKNG